MPWGEIGAIFLVLVAITVIGNLWFSFVESILDRIKWLLNRRREPPAWHPLVREQEEQQDD